MAILFLIAALISAAGVLTTGYVKLVLPIRRHDDRIRNEDEDLRRWVESEAAELRREEIAIVLRGHRGSARPYSMRLQKDKARKHILRRYEERLLNAERAVRDVKNSELAVHRWWRRFRDMPLPDLTTPTDKAEVIERWKTPLGGAAMSTTEADVPREKPIQLPPEYGTATAPFPTPDH